MGFLGLGKKRKCTKSIKYQDRVLEFGAKGSVPGTTIELSNFKTALKELEQASELAVIADDFQYQYCELNRHLKEDSIEFAVYKHKQEEALFMLTELRVTLTVFKRDPEGQREHLNLAVTKMQSVFDTLRKFEVPKTLTI